MSSSSATTDALGLAGTHWTLGAPGTNTLTVLAFNPLSGFPQWEGAPPYYKGTRTTATSVSCTP